VGLSFRFASQYIAQASAPWHTSVDRSLSVREGQSRAFFGPFRKKLKDLTSLAKLKGHDMPFLVHHKGAGYLVQGNPAYKAPLPRNRCRFASGRYAVWTDAFSQPSVDGGRNEEIIQILHKLSLLCQAFLALHPLVTPDLRRDKRSLDGDLHLGGPVY
jgi:hypothetical protein